MPPLVRMVYNSKMVKGGGEPQVLSTKTASGLAPPDEDVGLRVQVRCVDASGQQDGIRGSADRGRSGPVADALLNKQQKFQH